MEYADILGPDGTENNMGGTKQFFFYSPHRDILTIKEPDIADATTVDEFVIKLPHVMKTGKKFLKMYATIDTTELEAALQGETDGTSFKPTFKFWHPGSKKEIIRFLNNAKNDKFMFLVPLSDGTIIQLGATDWVAYVKPNFKSNKNSGSKGTEFMVECMMPDILIYEAAVPLTPAV